MMTPHATVIRKLLALGIATNCDPPDEHKCVNPRSFNYHYGQAQNTFNFLECKQSSVLTIRNSPAVHMPADQTSKRDVMQKKLIDCPISNHDPVNHCVSLRGLEV
jgi:hypothetical protein